MSKKPLFLKFLNQEVTELEMLSSFSQSRDPYTVKAAVELMSNPPDLKEFYNEFKDAVSDIIQEGFDDKFIAFVDHYMKPTLEDEAKTQRVERGTNVSLSVKVKDKSGPWIQGLICYNLSLYIKVFGLGALKKCRICSKFFDHKGKYAVYCSDACKARKNEVKKT